jgi:probable rRNA maturation factor
LNNFWLKSVASVEARVLGSVNIIFCSDDYLLNINKKYLSHDYYTDIITFDYCEKNILSGDLFISIDSVRDNAGFFNVSFSQELDRVIVHGLLHLIGYDDHTDEDIAVMRSKENCYIELKSKIRENE